MKRLALLVTVALMGALVACGPTSGRHCITYTTYKKPVYVYVKGQPSRKEWRTETKCTRWEPN